MNVFVIGGCHVDSYGIEPHLGFVQQWSAHLKKNTCAPVRMTCLSMVKLSQIAQLTTTYQSELIKADLIVLQLGHFELSWRRRFSELFQPATQENNSGDSFITTKGLSNRLISDKFISSLQYEPIKNSLKIGLLTIYQRIWAELPFVASFRNSLTDAFDRLKPYHNKVVAMTPFPTLNRLDQWLRSIIHPIMIESVSAAGFNLIDTFNALPRQKPYFLADGVHLNEQGHLAVATLLNECLLPIKYPVAEAVNMY